MPESSQKQVRFQPIKSRKLKVCSYNIHKGFSSGNTTFLLHKIREAIHLVDADILFLQEVVGENKKNQEKIDEWQPETQFEFLADTVWPHHAYGKNSVYSHGHHGNAILSRYPLSVLRNIDMNILPYSQRGVLHTVILGGIHLFCVHFGLFSIERKSQLKKLIAIIKKEVGGDSPLIIAGDFNDWRNHFGDYLQEELDLNEAITMIEGKPKATFPAIAPVFPMDRIYFRGLDLQHAEVLKGSPWNQLSDHCAVYAEFSFQC